MLAALDYLNWYGQAAPRGPWASPAILPSLTYQLAALDRITVYVIDHQAVENNSFFRVLHGATAGNVQAFIASLQALADVKITAYARRPAQHVLGAPAPAALDGAHPYAAAGYRFQFSFTPAAGTPIEHVIIPGLKMTYVITGLDGEAAVNLADPDIVSLAAAAALVMCNTSAAAITGLAVGKLLT